ncbi:MAG: hypothetical protein V4714_16565 [Bacteroidota bacterium]
MGNKRVSFEPGTVYHVYNHGNGTDSLFRSNDNYLYFLKKLAAYVHPVARFYAYCLMPNHFHLMVRIREVEELEDYFGKKYPAKDPAGFQNLPGLVSRQFADCFNSYSKAFNKMYGRQGSLFLEDLKRKPILTESYFTTLIHYIHFNPVHHGFVKKVDDWAHSSYGSFLSDKHTLLERQEVLGWFGGREDFINCTPNQPNQLLLVDMGF